jgi:hypothetical protein
LYGVEIAEAALRVEYGEYAWKPTTLKLLKALCVLMHDGWGALMLYVL